MLLLPGGSAGPGLRRSPRTAGFSPSPPSCSKPAEQSAFVTLLRVSKARGKLTVPNRDARRRFRTCSWKKGGGWPLANRIFHLLFHGPSATKGTFASRLGALPKQALASVAHPCCGSRGSRGRRPLPQGWGWGGGLLPALPPGSGFRGRIQSISLGWVLKLPRLSEERSHKGNFSSSFSVLIVKRLFTATGLFAGQQHVPAHVL